MIAGVVEGDLCWEAMAVAHVGTCAAQDVQMPLRARVEGGGGALLLRVNGAGGERGGCCSCDPPSWSAMGGELAGVRSVIRPAMLYSRGVCIAVVVIVGWVAPCIFLR